MVKREIGNATLYLADCRDVFPLLEPVDSIVTDPPYGLSFLGKAWDYEVPGVDIWQGALSAAKPGAHLLAFAGTRTQHRMAVNIEDAGWDIRELCVWMHGSGHPKALNIGNAVDRLVGAEPTVVGKSHSGKQDGSFKTHLGRFRGGELDVCVPSSEEGKKWQDWHTALKPAIEPITMARKPLSEKTVAANILKHGTGGLNIGACRVGVETGGWKGTPSSGMFSFDGDNSGKPRPVTGRWPANLMHDGSPEVVALFPRTGPSNGKVRNNKGGQSLARSGRDAPTTSYGHEDLGGSAARYFYCAKASRAERNEGLQGLPLHHASHDGRESQRHSNVQQNHHPTVKPQALMRHLVRLVTQPGGVVLDPFMGSGSTGVAAMTERMRFVGIEMNPDYFEIACRRIEHAQRQPQLGL